MKFLRVQCRLLLKRMLSYDTSWRLEPCTVADTEQMQQLLMLTMYQDEPLATTYSEELTKALGEDVATQHVLHDMLSEGHSIKAVTTDGRIVGAAINKMCPYNILDVEPVQQVVDFLQFVEKEMQLDCRGLLDLYTLAVHPDFRRQGMAKALAKATLDEAAKSGFRGIKITATSVFTANVAKSLGFNVHYSIAYKDYTDDTGRIVFNPQPPHTHLSIMFKEFGKFSKM